MPLIDRDDSLLLVIDAQPSFYGPERRDVDRAGFDAALERAAWMAAVAATLGVPIVATEEDSAANGPTDERIVRRLPPATPVLAKPVFSAADDPTILAAIAATGARTAVLVGLETDVCVCHSALQLRSRGYRVAVATDALFSPGPTHEQGIERMRSAGVELLSAKAVFYDWTRTLATVREFCDRHPDLAEPPGFAL